MVLGESGGLGVGLAVLQRAEQGDAGQHVGPHVEAAQRDPHAGAELRPQRLDVAHLLQLAFDRRGVVGGLVGGELVA